MSVFDAYTWYMCFVVLSAGWIRFMFMIAPAVYALVAPLCGWVSDKVRLEVRQGSSLKATYSNYPFTLIISLV